VKVVLRPNLRLRLKENFDRFNFALYKEKQMADFRRWFTVLAVLAVMAFTASAQVGVANGSANSLLACVATAAGTPELRPEGYTELAGDIVISCTGGPLLQQGASIPTTNIVIYMAPAVPITSRFMSSNGASEALLIIDEAGSNIGTGATANGGFGYGPNAPQSLCTTAQQQAVGGSSCNAVVGHDGSGGYEVAVVPGTSGTTNTPAQNVYQGKVGDFGVNSVTFYNVPVLPPATSGVSRTFRITNVRVPVPGGNLSGTLQAIVSTSPSQVLPVAGTAINIGVVGPATSAAVAQVTTPFQQCLPATAALSAVLTYTEGFATAFKTRVVPGGAANGIPGNSSGNVTYAAEGTNLAAPSNQNIPGGLYGGFASNSESGLIFPGLVTANTGTGAINYTAGLADYGTRLKAVFYNIPAGVTLYVSTTSAPVATFTVGGTSVSPYAVLIATNTGEATPDSNSTSGFTPIVGSTTSKGAAILGTDGFTKNNIFLNAPVFALTANSAGAAEAVWEVTNSNPSAQDVLQFGAFISYTATSATTANPYGLPITGLPLGAPVSDVQMSFAPEPSSGTFSTANATQGQVPTPRFAVIKTQEGPWVTINLCQTTLLYPFVTAATGFDTGIAVANTSWDPFGTVNQTGSCKLYAYGLSFATAPSGTALQTTLSGCDSIANPVSGTNCFPIVPAGQVGSVMASATFPNFTGYVIAVCNFQYAHGYAAVTDLGLRNLWSSYLALELGPLSQGVGSPRKGVQSIEQLIH
jgi:hypothetical protein